MKLNPSDPVAWIKEYVFIPETSDKRLILAPYQEACLREALSRDNGIYKYSTVLWSDIKKSIKSTIAAAVNLYRAYHTEWGQLLIIANDLRQADSRVGYYIRRAIELNPLLAADAVIRNYKITLHNHTILESIPIDPTGEAGSNADMITFSELWGAHHKAQQRMWTESTLSPTKYGQSQRWIESYAGFNSESVLLENLYEQGVKQGGQIDLSYDAHDLRDIEVFENKAARLFTLWNTRPRLPFQSPEYYAQESALLDPTEFNRVHRNQWASSADIFVPSEWWESCKSEVPTITDKDSIVIGIDAAVSNDSFAIVAVSKHEQSIHVRYVNEWKPPKGGQIDFREPELELRRLIKEYKVVCVVYDAYQLHDLMTRLGNERIAWFEAFGQTRPRLEADKALYDMIRDRRIKHNGDAILTAHVQNANRSLEKDNKMRIIKRAEHLKIDCVVALSMAAHQALSLNI